MENANLLYPDETYAIRGALFEVYREIGNGLREEVYQQCLEREFALRSIPFEAKKELCWENESLELESAIRCMMGDASDEHGSADDGQRGNRTTFNI